MQLRRLVAASLLGGLLLAAPTLGVEPGLPSKTAIAVAGLRAVSVHALRPEFRNPDYLAEKFLGPEEAAIMSDSPMEHIFSGPFSETVHKLRSPETGVPGMTLRTRHVDHETLEAVRNGATQIVVLGAGYDSRAYRFKEQLKSVRVFELDFPATQEYKKKRVIEALGEAPENVIYAPIDFTKQTLQQALPAAGYSRDEPTFFIWEGVTYYLSEEQVLDTLRFVAEHSGSNSSILFNFPTPELIQRQSPFQKWAGENGEPWTFAAFGPEIRDLTKKAGLDADSIYTYGELFMKYMPLDEPPSRYLGDTTGQQFCLARKR